MKGKVTEIGINKKVVPARIREARVSRGYSLADLSELLGVTSQAISQYELGNSAPSMVVLMKMVDILRFPLNFFLKPKENINPNYVDSAVYFRSMKSTPKKLKEAYKYRVHWADEIHHYLKKYIDFPPIDIPQFDDFNEIDFVLIEELALKLRSYWGIPKVPIDNMVELLQDKGFIICRLVLGNKKVDAFSQYYNNVPYIILGSDKSAVRSRFDLAHELGHLILHSHIDQESIVKKEILDKIEDEADCFAGAFLLPSNSFSQEVMSTSLEHFVFLKRRWKVSISAMIKRCERLNLLTDSQIRYLNAQMTKKQYWRNEPLDDAIAFEQPYLFKQAFELLIDNDIVTSDEILNELGYNKEEIDSLCFIPKDLLERKRKTKKLTLKHDTN
ncbi:helix-turn-helix domain-containing protein [Desulforamulus aeronauticus]|uniref:Zn-dependent peptidase ImmA, M78 family n=1 Tax=Desulforamulus aeronauticus DSM 10349 TaxID=1121421 RepID=A0A1M6USF6_9FIRM|nr:XRE family transcriptional regulator [Desulforamulus aeronauticus]SHK71996.1 Zn-dependent peptidase ImmA, M78 family [Desulforamulus aeronauticus DSM 10349]